MSMRKIALMVSLWTSTLFTAPVENPSAPRIIQEGFFISKDCWVNVRCGYEGDFVSDGRFEQCEQGSGRVDRFSQNTNAGTVTVSLLDRLDIYGILGSSKACAEWRFSINGSSSIAELETLYNFLWGIGARGILCEWGEAALGLGARYERADYSNLWLTIDGSTVPSSGTCLEWRVWQIDLDLAYTIDIFVPYIGIKYSNVLSSLGLFSVPIAGNGADSNHFKNRSPVGILVGCTLSTGKKFMLNVEGRLIDEEAVTISGEVRF